ncbi:MAG: ATP-binding cassette domain-containing protein [Chloroflexi bacterium]|nr:ATP-binding cassette domain-containing protein [Chloroflexota bacterium]
MIAVSKLGKHFNRGSADEVRALNDVSFQLGPGELFTVIGSNGAGKSTLLNCLAGVYPPDSGTIEIDGLDVTRQDEHRRAASIGRVFQNPVDGSAASLTVEENLALALRRGRTRGLRTGVTRARRELFAERLEQLGLGLEGRLRARAGTLSGGQRQALALLMATVSEPRVLLLDEHTSALDPAAALQVERLTTSLVGEHRLTTLMVTHNLQQALRIGTRTLMLHAGEIVLDLRDPERRSLTVQDLMVRFQQARGQSLADDELLLPG